MLESVSQRIAEHPTVIPMLLGLIVAITGIVKQRQSSREKNSIDFEASYKRSKDVQDAWITLMDTVRNNTSSSLSIWGNQKNYKTIESSSFRLILNEWERAANGIFRKIYDDDFLYKTYGSTVIDLYKFLGEYIFEIQKRNPRIYLQFTKLAIAWKIRRSLEDKTKVDQQLIKIHKQLRSIS